MIQAATVFALLAAPAIGLVVLVYLLVRALLDFKRANSRRVSIALKALASLAVWFFASWGMFFMFFVTAYTAGGHGSQVEEARVDAMMLLFLDLLYAVVGCGLALWVRHKSEYGP
jgi:hypothetical protein